MKLQAPAVGRNREPIAAVLAEELPPRGLVLEVASGTGEHAAFYAERFPALEWQPSDGEREALASIAAWRSDAGLPNLRPPLVLDAAAPDWPIASADAILCVNMVHISPWAATEGLFAGAARILGSGAPLVLYGPYLEGQTPPAESNLAFDQSLRRRNAQWGIRRLEDIDGLSAAAGFVRSRRVDMPANNLTLVYRRC